MRRTQTLRQREDRDPRRLSQKKRSRWSAGRPSSGGGRSQTSASSSPCGCRKDGRMPAPESCHAIAATIREALKCKETGEEQVILFNFSGHGLIDMPSYDQFINGDLRNYDLTDEELGKSMANLPHLA